MNNSGKKNLQNFCEYPVLNAKEALDYLGWEYTDDGNGNYSDIKCCGELIECTGFFGGTEDLECKKCGKHIHDLFGVTQITNSTCTILNPKDFEVEENRHWVAIVPNGVLKSKS